MGGRLQPPILGQSHYFRAKGKFFGHKPAAKNEKKLYLLNEKNRFHSVLREKVPKIRDLFLLIITGWG